MKDSDSDNSYEQEGDSHDDFVKQKIAKYPLIPKFQPDDNELEFDLNCAVHRMIEKSLPRHFHDLSAWTFHSPLSHLSPEHVIKRVNTFLLSSKSDHKWPGLVKKCKSFCGAGSEFQWHGRTPSSPQYTQHAHHLRAPPPRSSLTCAHVP